MLHRSGLERATEEQLLLFPWGYHTDFSGILELLPLSQRVGVGKHHEGVNGELRGWPLNILVV